ncbi:Mitochondrial phosphate carrier protein 1, mitochondrial [Asimina triloba]
MFSTFEHSVDLLYHNILQRRKEDCSRTQQLGVTCVAGYAAGAIGTLVSNPADNIVASLYNKKADSILQELPASQGCCSVQAVLMFLISPEIEPLTIGNLPGLVPDLPCH